MSLDNILGSIKDCSGYHGEQMPPWVGEQIIAILLAGHSLAHAVYSGESDKITQALAAYMDTVKEDV